RNNRPAAGGPNMGVPRLPTAMLLLAASPLAFGQDLGFARSSAAPAARIGLAPNPAADTLPPPVLPAPGAAMIPGSDIQPLPGEFRPNHSFASPENPSTCSGGCDGDCQPCRRLWLDAAFFIGKAAENLPGVDRRYLYGWQAIGGFWFDDVRTLGLEFGFF